MRLSGPEYFMWLPVVAVRGCYSIAKLTVFMNVNASVSCLLVCAPWYEPHNASFSFDITRGLKSTKTLLSKELAKMVAPISVVVQRAARHQHFWIDFSVFPPGLASSRASLSSWCFLRRLGGHAVQFPKICGCVRLGELFCSLRS